MADARQPVSPQNSNPSVMKLYPSQDYDTSLDLVETLMLPYYAEYGLEWHREERKKLYQQSEHFSIQQDGQFAGILVYGFREDDLYIYELEILQEQQGKGLGSQAIQYLETIAKEKQIGFIRLNVFKSNSAFEFYRKQGFTLAKEGKMVYSLEKAVF